MLARGVGIAVKSGRNMMEAKLSLRVQLSWLLLSSLASWGASAGEIDLADVHDAANTARGTVLMSVSVSGDEPVSYLPLVVQQPGQPRTKVVANIGRVLFKSNETFSAADGRWGRLVAWNLEPGEWSFPATMVAMQGAGAGYQNMRTIAPLDLKFNVKAGEVVYVGNLDYVLTREPRIKASAVAAAFLLGASQGSTTGNPVVHDLHDRDLALFKAADAKLDLSKVRIELMQAGADAERYAESWAKKAVQGDPVARAGMASATVFGSQAMPDGGLLRLPAQSVRASDALREVLLHGEPERATLLTLWTSSPALFNRAPPALDASQRAELLRTAAAHYGAAAVTALGQKPAAEGGVAPLSAEEAAALSARAALLQRGLRGNVDSRWARFVPVDVVKAYHGDASKRKALLATASGQGMVVGDDGSTSLGEAAGAWLARCQAGTGETCFVVTIDDADRTSVCPIALSASPLATSFPPLDLPAVDRVHLSSTAWGPALSDALLDGELNVAPRAVVWGGDKTKAYAASGQCGAAYKAWRACIADGNKQCELVLQDDRITQGSPYANEVADRFAKPASATTAMR
jgi:hypothetical protein